jgi:hypothetical protein
MMTLAVTLAVVFQNCGGYQSAVNPLTDTPEASECVGVSCSVDLEFVEIKIANTQPVGVVKPTTTQEYCDPTTCVDIAGYCNTAGYTDSKFYYQWKFDNGVVGPRVATSMKCDSNGRFRLLIELPRPTVHQFIYENLYAVEITMVVLDGFAEYENPSAGVGTQTVTVTGI